MAASVHHPNLTASNSHFKSPEPVPIRNHTNIPIQPKLPSTSQPPNSPPSNTTHHNPQSLASSQTNLHHQLTQPPYPLCAQDIITNLTSARELQSHHSASPILQINEKEESAEMKETDWEEKKVQASPVLAPAITVLAPPRRRRRIHRSAVSRVTKRPASLSLLRRFEASSPCPSSLELLTITDVAFDPTPPLFPNRRATVIDLS
ncbi:hypothetical protein M0R45_019512 [Rubus argutus]|uniref:Uncharacterized protein n=1 Tax=Rubus argutus TaxID=59490 RepID=A0AAW1X5J2_RUBAR